MKKEQLKQIRALTFGEALFDIIKGSAHLGGAPLNLAAHLAKLGAKPAVLTAAGKDEHGKILLARAEEMGVDTSYILTDENRPTGTVTVELKNEGIPVFSINEGVAWDAITPDESKFKALTREEWDVFCFGTLAQRSEENRKTLERLLLEIKAKNVFYDVNLRTGFYRKEWISFSLEHCTILKMNEEEAATISRMFFGTVHSFRTLCLLLSEKCPEMSVICITKGPEGAAVYHEGIYEEVAVTPVEVADTVGAGDAFSAGFLYTYLSGYGVSKAASIASILGTYVASKPGSVPEYSEELIKVMEIRPLLLLSGKNRKGN
ncbi:carbohydrate kinase [Methanosarcina sp.]|uniref:carbohydrate kinase family protein n=1 Tax=Methanosarcina sp. TaxID=2213 RepID=UPI002C547B0F|nr:carbohydrate kinase [Methanosarcina sp.]HOW14042.1 carbohydrate kinase [Methanosarcina sp.]